MCAPDRPKSPTDLNDAPSGPPDASRDLLAHPRLPRGSNPGGSLGFNRPNRLPNSGLVAPHPGGRPTQLLPQESLLVAMPTKSSAHLGELRFAAAWPAARRFACASRKAVA
eukprot:SAG31_NODE_1521_length_8022_cov_17.832261_8_plen_111_part_00